MTDYKSIEEIKAAAAVSAHSREWFTPSAMRFFGTRLGSKVFGGHYFVTSEQGPDGVRGYSVRSCFDGNIDTVGEFRGYASRARAEGAARRLAARLARTCGGSVSR